MSSPPPFNITLDQSFDFNVPLNKDEEDELRIMQEIFDESPDVAEELFSRRGSPVLARRYRILQGKKLNKDVSSIASVLSQQLAAEIDKMVIADIVKAAGISPPVKDSNSADPLIVDDGINLS